MAKYAVYLIVILVFIFVIPLFFLIHLQIVSIKLIFIFYLANIILAIFLFKKQSKFSNRIALLSEELQEKINILKDENSKENKFTQALRQKINRYNSLKKIIEEINQSLSLDSVVEQLILIAANSIADNKGSCILYLADKETHRLSLYRARKDNKKLVVKAKQGDVFDSWVLHHASPLLVEDIHNDFRFDLERIKDEERTVSSLISAPFVSDGKFLGLLRLDSPEVGFYSQDDLRFLVTICDLGAIAIENSELYLKTQELAIHDGLTSLYRKGYLLERLNEEYKRGVRQNKKFSLLMLDIDYFKKYNEKFGHTAGDIVLKELSAVLRDLFKEKSSVIGRFGGEEFCVILSGIDKDKAILFAEELRKKVEERKVVLRKIETNVTVSIGVASFPEDARDETELILKADKAMYEAKESGRNKVVAA